MAHSPSTADQNRSLADSRFAAPATPLPPLPSFPPSAAFHTPNHSSVAMEPSISSSSVSSSVASFLSATTSTSSPPASTYMPTTPQHQLLSLSRKEDLANMHSSSSSSSVHGDAMGRDVSAFTMALGLKKPLDISNLMSPPEPDQMDSFSINNDDEDVDLDKGRRSSISDMNLLNCPPAGAIVPGISVSHAHTVENGVRMPGHGPLSPPISPKDKRPTTASSDTSRDPILYPASSDGSPPSSLSRPLFADAATVVNARSDENDVRATATDVVNGHVAARSPTLFRRALPPAGEDYELALYLKSEMMNRYMSDRHGWLKKEREQLMADRKAAAHRNKLLQIVPPPTSKSISMAAPMPRVLTPRTVKPQYLPQELQQPGQQPLHHQSSQHSTQQRQAGSLHPVLDQNARVAKRANRTTPASRAAGPPTRIAPQVNGSSRQASGGSGGSIRVPGSSPEPRVRTSAPNREDKDFISLPDYCPPLSTLPERTNNLKVDWKGNALDLSRDPYLHLLHRDEVGLAASLRLDCATYLTSKRRIFVRRLECARIGKEFRKTDAQQACKIDVNKASKLWTAYEKVGWLRIEHMRQFI